MSAWNRPQAILWFKRTGRYFPHIERLLASAGVPDDLKYLPVVESALRPHAGSAKGAIGFWQFMPATGRKYGLRVDARIDERRNLFASTKAAIAYLKELRELFGSWTLAVAAYNMGEKGLQAEILEQGVEDYYRLYLPLETQRFVPRLIAVKTILSRPSRFGLQGEKRYPPLVFDRVGLTCLEETPLRIVAQAAGTDFKRIKELNPELRGHYIAAGVHELLVPRGGAHGFEKRFAELWKRFSTARRERVYIVRKGDTLSSIAADFDVPLVSMLIWNRLDPRKPIYPGQRIVIYPQGQSGVAHPEADEGSGDPASRQ